MGAQKSTVPNEFTDGNLTEASQAASGATKYMEPPKFIELYSLELLKCGTGAFLTSASVLSGLGFGGEDPLPHLGCGNRRDAALGPRES